MCNVKVKERVPSKELRERQEILIMKHMRYVIHLKLANDSFKCDSACVS